MQPRKSSQDSTVSMNAILKTQLVTDNQVTSENFVDQIVAKPSKKIKRQPRFFTFQQWEINEYEEEEEERRADEACCLVM